MIAEAEPTDCGLKVMTETGEIALSFIAEPGLALMSFAVAGCAPLKVPVPLEVLDNLASVIGGVATNARILARLADETHGAEPMVPRNARATVAATA